MTSRWLGALRLLVLSALALPLFAQQKPELIVQEPPRVISSIAWRPDQRVLATANSLGGAQMMRLWEPEEGHLLRSFPHQNAVLSVSWTPDGEKVTTVESRTHLVRTWNASTGELLWMQRIRGAVNAQWHPNGVGLAIGCFDRVLVLDESSLKHIGGFVHPSQVTSALAWSVDGRLARGVGSDVWVLEGEELSVLRLDGAEVTAVAWSSDGALAVADERGVVSVWQNGKRLHQYRHEGRVSSLHWNGRGRLASLGDDRHLRVWNSSNLELLNWKPEDYLVKCVRWSPDGNSLAVGGFGLVLWDANGQSRSISAISHFRPAVNSLSWSPDGASLATDRTVIWDLASGVRRSQFDCDRRGSGGAGLVSWSPDGAKLAESFMDQTHPAIRLWDVAGRKPLKVLTSESTTGGHREVQLEWSPDGRHIALATDEQVEVWDPAVASRIFVARAQERVESFSWSPDSETLAVGGGGRVDLWTVRTAEREASLDSPGVSCLSWKPDGQRLAVGTRRDEQGRFLDHETLAFDIKGVTEIWDPRTGELKLTLEGGASAVTAVSWSPDGSHLAVGRRYGTVDLWQPADSRARKEVQAQTRSVRALAWHPKGHLVVASGDDGTMAYLDRDGQVLVRAAALDTSTTAKDWQVTSPEGFFDGSPAGWNSILWRIGQGALDVVAPELFFSEFYQPGLLADVIQEGRTIPKILEVRGDPRARLNIAEKDRRQPSVSLEVPSSTDARTVPVIVRVDGGEGESAPGAKDVRLFRNGSLVAYWPGIQRSRNLAANVSLTSGKNRLTAYAFNRDNVKSKDATALVTADFSARESVGHILTIGIDEYQGRPDLSLSCAVNDAQSLATRLVQAMPVGRVEKPIVLSDHQATRARILTELEALSSKAQPEDTVVVAFACHGFLKQNSEDDRYHFYLLPHDLQGASEGGMTDRAISDSELESAFLKIDAESLVLVLDACHSGGALDAPEWRRGPMNARGFAQLAWEKGMEIITASQSAGLAREVGDHGLLTEALLRGLTRARVEADGTILVESWLDYAARLVPELAGSGPDSVLVRAVSLWREPQGAQLQTPRVFQSGKKWAISERHNGDDEQTSIP